MLNNVFKIQLLSIFCWRIRYFVGTVCTHWRTKDFLFKGGVLEQAVMPRQP